MEQETAPEGVSQTVRLGGYLIAGGALSGFSVGIYFLFNHSLFASLLQIGQFEVTSYFLSIFMPSFLILIAIGYLLATSSIKKLTLSNVAYFCLISVACIVLSALSVLFFVSFLGGFLILTLLVKDYARPVFRSLSKRESLFVSELGALFVASFGLLFLFMQLIPSFLQTYYPVVSYGADSLVMVIALSILMFLAFPVLNSRSKSTGLNAVFCFVVTVLTLMFVVQNGYVFTSIPAVMGLFMLVGGFALLVFGNLVNLYVFVSEMAVPEPEIIKTYSLLRKGRYCPYCGKPRGADVRDFCSHCNRSLMWSPYSPFCTSCGHLIPPNAQACPHCKEDIESKRVMFDLKNAEERTVSGKVMSESLSGMKPSKMTDSFLRIPQAFYRVGRAFWSIPQFLGGMIERSSLTLKEAAYSFVLTGVFAFVSFIAYVRMEPDVPSPGMIGEIRNYGFPMTWLRVYTAVGHGVAYRVSVLWTELILDILLFFLVALGIVYLLTRVLRAPKKSGSAQRVKPASES